MTWTILLYWITVFKLLDGMSRSDPYIRVSHQDAVAMPGSGRPDLLWHATHAAHWTTGPLFGCDRERYPGHQLMFVLGGRGVGSSGGHRWQAGPGQAVVLDLNLPHRYQTDPADPWELIWVIIDSRAPGIERQFRTLTGGGGPVVPFASPSRVREAAAALYPLIRRGQPGDAGWIHHHLAALMADLFSAQAGDRPPSQDRAGLADALRLVRSQYARTIALAELADAAGITASHFVRRFRAATGTTPFRYLERYRIARAQELLRAGSSRSVAEVGAQVGYGDPAYFSRVFRRTCGVTPSAYRGTQQ
jgi:AraC family transcriptional regulator of arabinose operon